VAVVFVAVALGAVAVVFAAVAFASGVLVVVVAAVVAFGQATKWPFASRQGAAPAAVPINSAASIEDVITSRFMTILLLALHRQEQEQREML
jgi:hypothetical protein